MAADGHRWSHRHRSYAGCPSLRIYAITYPKAYAVNPSAIGSATPLLLIRTTM